MMMMMMTMTMKDHHWWWWYIGGGGMWPPTFSTTPRAELWINIYSIDYPMHARSYKHYLRRVLFFERLALFQHWVNIWSYGCLWRNDVSAIHRRVCRRMFESTADNKSPVRPSLRREFITFSRRAAFTVYIVWVRSFCCSRGFCMWWWLWWS